MVPLTIYGSAQSRTMRVLWMAAELNLKYQHVAWEWDDPRLKQPDFLKLNPAGCIPTLVDGDLALGESMAINLYLAKRYGEQGAGSLYPQTEAGEAQALRWSLWAQGELEPWVQKDAMLLDAMAASGKLTQPAIQRSLSTLERALQDREWLLGDHFSVADLNVAGVLSPSRAGPLDHSGFERVGAWLDACYARPACQAVRRQFTQ